jgi:hypothetical protein
MRPHSGLGGVLEILYDWMAAIHGFGRFVVDQGEYNPGTMCMREITAQPLGIPSRPNRPHGIMHDMFSG